MLNGPALLRVFLVVIAAAILTGLVQHYWMFDSTPPEAPKVTARPALQGAIARRPDPPARSPPSSAEAPQPVAAPQPQPQALGSASAPPETQNAALMPPPVPEPPPVRAPPVPRAPPRPPPAAAEPESAEEQIAAAESADPRAVDLVDLNTGSLAALNGLKGGGSIGRAIIQRRPYASTDQLLSKRVLSRGIYQRIKDQVTVR